MAEGVKVVEDNETAGDDEVVYGDRKGHSVPVPFKKTFQIGFDESGNYVIPEESTEGSVGLENTITLSVEIPRIEYELMCCKKDESEILIKIPSVVKTTCKAGGEFSVERNIFEKNVPLGATGFEAKFTIKAVIDMNGNVSLTSTIRNKI